MTGPLYPQTKPEDYLTDRDIELLYFFINRKDLTKLKLDDVSILCLTPFIVYKRDHCLLRDDIFMFVN